MAETTGKQTPDTDPKATEKPAEKPAGKTGPVRPPVLEGTAKPTTGGASADSTRSSSTTARTDKPSASNSAAKPAREPAAGSGGIWLAGVVGGALGLGAAYGLAWFGLWPTPEQAAPPADPRLAQFATAIPELETVTGTVQDELSTLTGRVGALEANLDDQPTSAIDTSTLASNEDLAALSARLDELAAGSADSTAAPESLAAIEAELSALRASAGTGFKSPSFYALGDPLVGNADLEDERDAQAQRGRDGERAHPVSRRCGPLAQCRTRVRKDSCVQRRGRRFDGQLAVQVAQPGFRDVAGAMV